jgi:hypothetical protein
MRNPPKLMTFYMKLLLKGLPSLILIKDGYTIFNIPLNSNFCANKNSLPFSNQQSVRTKIDDS